MGKAELLTELRKYADEEATNAHDARVELGAEYDINSYGAGWSAGYIQALEFAMTIVRGDET